MSCWIFYKLTETNPRLGKMKDFAVTHSVTRTRESDVYPVVFGDFALDLSLVFSPNRPVSQVSNFL